MPFDTLVGTMSAGTATGHNGDKLCDQNSKSFFVCFYAILVTSDAGVAVLWIVAILVSPI